jgi:hypothetical protein
LSQLSQGINKGTILLAACLASHKNRPLGYYVQFSHNIKVKFSQVNLDGAFDFAGTQATGADIYFFGCSVNYCFDWLNIGFPLTVGSYMGVAVLFSKAHAFPANITFGHYFAPSLKPCT